MSTRDQQQAKYWPTPKAYAALTTNPDGPMNPLVEDGDACGLLEPVLDEGLRQMRTWTAEEIIEILEDAATILVTLRDAS